MTENPEFQAQEEEPKLFHQQEIEDDRVADLLAMRFQMEGVFYRDRDRED